MPLELTQAQKIVIDSYEGGEYGFLAREAANFEDWPSFRTYYRDTLQDATFDVILCEASPSEDCNDVAEALRRVQRLVEDIRSVEGALEEALQNTPAPGQ